MNEEQDWTDEVVMSRMLRLFEDRGIACAHFNNHTMEDLNKNKDFNADIDRVARVGNVNKGNIESKDNTKDTKPKQIQRTDNGVSKDAKDVNKNRESALNIDITSDTFL